MPEQLEAAPPATAEVTRGAPAARPSSPRTGTLRALVRAARPRQWTKNLLVIAAPGAAGVLTDWPEALHVAMAFAAFCLVASGTYLLNDVSDLEADRRHPRKRHRPVAAGALDPRTATLAGTAMTAVGLVVAGLVGWELLATVTGYLVLTMAYTFRLRHVAVVDLAAVATFYVIRAVAGGVAVDVPLSRWFLIVASFGSLFIVAGKRAGEFAELGDHRTVTRPALGAYSLEYLRHVRTIAAGVAVTAYCLWAFSMGPRDAVGPFYELSIVPFVLFLMRYALLVESDREQAPEDLVLGDRALQLMAVAWIALFGCGVYLGG